MKGKLMIMFLSMIFLSMIAVQAWSQDKVVGPAFKHTPTWEKKGIVPLWTADNVPLKGPEFKSVPTEQVRNKEITVEARMRKIPKKPFGPRAKNRKPWG